MTRNEEIANAVSHAVGALLALAAAVVLTMSAAASADIWRIVTYPIFGASMIVLYSASTVYHGNRNEEWHLRLKLFDHIAIYYLIAGSYTPVTLVVLRGEGGWLLFGLVWGLAIGGTVFKLIFADRYPILSTMYFVAMGWVAVIAIRQLFRALPPATFTLLIAGGLSYTFGVGFYAWRRLPYHHAIWHLFVLGGTACHVAVVLML